MMLQRVMIYVFEHRILHDKAWLIKWVRRLLTVQCVNILMICPNSVEPRRCPSRWSIVAPVTFFLPSAAFPFHTNILASCSHVYQCNSLMVEIMQGTLKIQNRCLCSFLAEIKLERRFFSMQCWTANIFIYYTVIIKKLAIRTEIGSHLFMNEEEN